MTSDSSPLPEPSEGRGPDDDLHLWGGAYAADALSPDDRARFETHLADCDRCQTTVDDFAAVADLLNTIDHDELDRTVDQVAERRLVERTRHEVARLERSRNQWRLATLGVAAAAVLGIAGTVVLAGGSTDQPVEDAIDRGAEVDVVTSEAQAAAVFAATRQWGTEVFVELAGLPPSAEYQLWVVDETGEWSRIGSWGPTTTGGARITGAARMPTDTVARIVVTTNDRDQILVDAST